MNRLTRLATRFNSPKSKLLSVYTRLKHQSNAVRYSPPINLSLRQFSTATPLPNLGAGTQDSEPIRRVLPPELLFKNVVKLTCESSAKDGICHVYLIGTRHYSKKSCREVEAVISYLKPEAVFLELCWSRKGILTKNFKIRTEDQMSEMLERNNDYVLQFRLAWDKAAEDLGLHTLDTEFRVAYEEAIKYGCRVFLGDRPIDVKIFALPIFSATFHPVSEKSVLQP
ncbi:hypothetical protein TorRG33x02_108420 [Trema orientale]|uniref:Pheromone shutdown n=1 Tax=Trema orientale TaxID=63057 RepID=A0A2P5F654_TREOI|nr:hypothetical protein TorRG33x02_108420 [Trema orientale]